MPLPLVEIFPDEDYRFHLTLRKGLPADFFGKNEAAALAERAHWLRAAPELYTGFRPGAEPLLREFERLAGEWGSAESAELPGLTPEQRLLRVGQRVEADFLLLAENEPAHFQLEMGVVCFPSSWSPAEKFGLGLEAIHGVVPRLNSALGPTIGQFLQRLRPGAAFERANWGLAATPERNMHPHRRCPRLTADTPVTEVWVRVEDQLLTRLPDTHAILFGIKLRIVPLAEALADEGVRRGLLRALRTMPDDVAAYKGLGAVRDALLARLPSGPG